MKVIWTWSLAALVLGMTASVGVAQPQGGRQERPAGDLPGPVDSLQDLQDTARMAFATADTNNDGQISKKEAVDAGNLIVGGFFFRADADGNGTLTREEAREAREAFLRQNPVFRAVAQEVRRTRGGGQGGEGNNSNPIRNLADLLDENNDRQLQASELRQAVQTTVDGLYEAADTNRDGQMSRRELNAAVSGLGQQAAQAAFQAADKDNNGSLSLEEYDQAIVEPARLFFRVIDADNDNQITPQEAQTARRVFMNQLRSLRANDARRGGGAGQRRAGRGQDAQGQPDQGSDSGDSDEDSR